MSPGEYVAELHRLLQSHPSIAAYHLETDCRGESFLYACRPIRLTSTKEMRSGHPHLLTCPPSLQKFSAFSPASSQDE